MDIESIVIQQLKKAGIQAGLSVKGDTCVTVVRVGGGLSTYGIVDKPQLVFAARAATPKEALNLAQRAQQVVLHTRMIDNIFDVQITTQYRDDDPDTRQPRYKFNAEFVTNN